VSEGASTTDWLIFVSHAGEDTWVARQIAREIAERGARSFLDEADIDIAAEFEDDIRQFLEQADEMLVLFTPWALSRRYVWAEIGAAWLRDIPIVVVLYGLTIQEVQSQPMTPVFLKARNTIQLNDLDEYLDELEARVARMRDGDA
jgi:hypothetical protein